MFWLKSKTSFDAILDELANAINVAAAVFKLVASNPNDHLACSSASSNFVIDSVALSTPLVNEEQSLAHIDTSKKFTDSM